MPIHEIAADIRSTLSTGTRLVIQAPTGSGKSTQVPQILLDHNLAGGQIVILQPRRIATRMLAARVARERGVRLGAEVGFQIRFDDCSGPDTMIKFVTEGILLRKMLSDPQLKGIGTLIFDEFHERHIYSDVTLALALRLQQEKRPDLRIIVMSATLDADALEDYLWPCRVLSASGRMYPVDIRYLQREPDPRRDAPWQLAAREVEYILKQQRDGDVLVFMPGVYEISRTIQALGEIPAARDCEILPLHGELPPQTQDLAVNRSDRRKIIVSTNVAETALTIDGIVAVVDSGLARVPSFDPYRGINTLLIEKISKASAEQRAGRAGRTAPGICARLWTEADQAGRPDHELPEIRRLDLAEIMLSLKAAGIKDPGSFKWFEPPESKALAKAIETLTDLGALDRNSGAITELGLRLSAFPVHPRYARMFLAAGEYGCVPLAALIAALTQERKLLLPRQGSDVEHQRDLKLNVSEESDFAGLVSALDFARRNDFRVDACRQVGVHGAAGRQVDRIHRHFMQIARGEGLDVETNNTDADAIAKCILLGFSDHLACRLSAGSVRCQMVHGKSAALSKESSVRKSRLLVACEVHEIERRGELDVTLSLATAVKEEWLRDLFPGDFSEQERVVFDESAKRVAVERAVLFRDMPIEVKKGGIPRAEAAAPILAEEVAAGRLRLVNWDATVEQWVLRVNALAVWCPDLGLREIGADDKKTMYEQICLGAFSFKEAKEKPVWPVLKSWFSPQQQAMLDKHTPERITLSNGRNAKVTYTDGKEASIALPIQSLYGVNDAPKIAMGRVTLTVNILAPSHRPVQVTRDMRAFWRDHYPRVKQELQRRYPKHEWR